MATSTLDPFAPIARYYDVIMEHVDYRHWRDIAAALRAIGPDAPYLDAACGTGSLLAETAVMGWPAYGFDLSPAMCAAARRRDRGLRIVRADLRALPFRRHFGLVTCLFDSLNFVTEEDELAQVFQNLSDALAPGGLIFFDLVTERMVRDHFEGQTWVERNGNFETRWNSHYDRATGIAETTVRVNTGVPATIRERIYTLRDVEAMLDAAGLTLLGAYDADSWRRPGRRTTRIDIVAACAPAPRLLAAFRGVERDVRAGLPG